MKSLLHSHSKHPSYKSILFKNKKQSSFPQSSNSLCCSCSFKKIYPRPEVEECCFPHKQWLQLLTLVLKAAELETQGPRRETCWEVRGGGRCKVAASTVRAHRIFLYPGNWDQGGEPACSPQFLGKQISGTCLSQLSRSLKNKRESN